MNDSAISTELFNFSILPKSNARGRKTQLQHHLIDVFADPAANRPSPKTVAPLKPRQVKRIRKSLHNQSKHKPKKLRVDPSSGAEMDLTTTEDPVQAIPPNTPTSSEFDQTPATLPTICSAASDSKLAQSESGRPDNGIIPNNLSQQSNKPPSLSSPKDKPLPAFSLEDKTLSTTSRKDEPHPADGPKGDVRNTNPSTKPKSKKSKAKKKIKAEGEAPTVTPLPEDPPKDYEKPWKTLEDNIIALKNKSCRRCYKK